MLFGVYVWLYIQLDNNNFKGHCNYSNKLLVQEITVTITSYIG